MYAARCSVMRMRATSRGERNDAGVDHDEPNRRSSLRRKRFEADDWSRSWPTGWTVEHVDETGSTNSDLLESADRRVDRSVLVADHQRAGRGRLDRRWEAPPGENLLVSVLFHRVPADPGELLRRVSLAAVDAIRAEASSAGRVGLKWPNDVLLVNDHASTKVAGVLAQRSGTGAVVVGIGINVGWCPVGGARLGPGVSRGLLLRAMLRAYDRLPVGSEDLLDRYREELATLGQHVRVETATGGVVGVAVDVTALGQLVVRDADGAVHHVDVADVTHLRPTARSD